MTNDDDNTGAPRAMPHEILPWVKSQGPVNARLKANWPRPVCVARVGRHEMLARSGAFVFDSKDDRSVLASSTGKGSARA